MKLLLKYIMVIFIIQLTLSPVSARQAQNVTLQLKWKHQFQFAGYYAAIEKGYYKEVGLQVNLLEATEGLNPSDAVFEGKAEFGVCSSDVLIMRSQHKKAVVLATIFQHSPQILLALKKSGIGYVQDLVGKRIALEPNAADIIAYMNDEGVPPDKCAIDELTFNVDKLIKGEIDAISAYSTDEPFILKEAGFDYTIISPSMGGIDFYGDLLFTTESFIKNNPELVDNFRKASLKGWSYAMSHPEEIVELIYNRYSKRHSLEHLRYEAGRMSNLIMDDLVEMGYTNPGRWKSIAGTYKKLKMLDDSFTTEGLLYSDYVKPKKDIRWDLVAMRLMILLITGSVAYFFYRTSKRLKNEIKNRVKTEKDLLESEEKYRIIFENNSAAMAIIEPDATISMVNEAFCQITGFTGQEVIGSGWEQHIPPLDIERLKEYSRRRQLNPDDAPNKYRFTFFHKNGEVRYSLMSVTTLNYNRKIILSFLDVTEIKHAEEEKQKIDEWLRTLSIAIEQSPVTTVITDLAGNIVFVNPKFTETTGYMAEEAIGKNPRILNSGTKSKSEYKELWDTILSGQSWHGIFYNKKKNGEFYWESAVISPVKNKEGVITHFLAVKEDITQRIKVEEEIKLKNEELVKTNSEKDKFFSIIAHDLRSPFNGFLGLTQIMVEELSSLTRDEIQDIAVSMQKSATNLFRLLKNLLNWARMQQGLIPFNKELVALLPVVSDSVEMLRESAKNKKIELIINFPDHLEVFVDTDMLQTVIRNLVSNAVKFTPRGGKVSLSAKTLENKDVEISIADSGIGMNQSMIDNLFRLDVKTNRNGTDDEPSTGLGLLLCREFVEKHGGKLWVESQEGKGSVFYFTIPYVDKLIKQKQMINVTSVDKVENRVSIKSSELKILLAEDDDGSARIITQALKIISKEVIRAINGVEAVEACRNNPDINLVLMDIQMPEMDGYEATRKIRQFNPDVIIIAQTAYALTNNLENAITAGCNDYISKPIKKDKLFELIQKYFNI
jgi:PAS domain S-box-containing protein